MSAAVNARVIVNDDGHILCAVIDEGIVKRDGGPTGRRKVHLTAEDEVGIGNGDPLRGVFKNILVGTHHIDVQVAGVGSC